jgi:hypothetical protein
VRIDGGGSGLDLGSEGDVPTDFGYADSSAATEPIAGGYSGSSIGSSVSASSDEAVEYAPAPATRGEGQALIRGAWGSNVDAGARACIEAGPLGKDDEVE